MNAWMPSTEIAANEGFFHQSRVRSAPIKSSMTCLDGLPKSLKIYRIAGSKYWQVRFYNQGRYITQSLKTTCPDEAKAFAHLFFEKLKAAGLRIGKVEVSSATTAFQNQQLLHDLMQEVLHTELQKVQRDQIKHGTYVMTQIRLEGLIFEFFSRQTLHEIDERVLEDFIEFLTRKNLTTSTIQGYIAQTRKVLRLLSRKKILPAVPSFPALKSQPNPRGAFTLTEYSAILRRSKKLRDHTYVDWRNGQTPWIRSAYHQMPTEMNWLIRFMVYTFVRPGDIRQIKNKHIEVVRNGYSYLRLNLPEVKRHKAATVSLPAAVQIYATLLKHQKSQGYGHPDDYVFFPELQNRRMVIDIAGWCLNWILKDLGLKAGPHGVDRSLYSLRHTAITFRLIYGGNIDLLTLARNARTSVEMIEKFYASTLSAEMNIALLHGKRQ